MTHLPAASPALPLSLTCSADERFAETIALLAGRVAAAAGTGAHVAAFTQAMTEAVRACLTSLGDAAPGGLRVDLSYSDVQILGRMRWPADAPETDRCTAAVQAAAAPLVESVECGRSGDEAYCRLSCRRG
jgi:hypothetical protein